MRSFRKLMMIFSLIAVFLLNASFVSAKPARKTGTPPTAPTSLTYSGVTTSEATLTWQGVSGATGYSIYRATPNDSNYTLLTKVTTTSFKNTALTANTKYWYFVRAYNAYGTSPDSTHINLTTAQIVVEPEPTPVPVEPTPTPVAKKLVLGYTTYYYSGDSSSYNSMTTNTSTLDEIATATYTTDAYGNVTGLVPTNQITYANSNNIKTLAMIANNFDGNIARSVLQNSVNRQAFINNILNIVKVNGYKGVNIDLEGVYASDRSYLTTFMSELYNTLHPQGFYVSMAVPAKTFDSLTNSWTGAYDYAALGKYVDQMVLMTYDEHYPGGTAGPVASIGWVESVIKYAVSVIPKEKILVGTAAYGYDWSSNGTKAYGINGINNLATTYGATIQWDSVSQCPYFNYTDASGVSHSVWFENAYSLNFKLDLVNSYDVAGIAIWRLGLENADYWTSIKTKFNR
ncbi:glycosyl hydrolase family 18 protein [Clostridium cellulovorans]|uniref:Glycoside hydrolase family 18 n=1 Tax=Clostridium cellulovorans (strain ATCC 35296 / DSM 3052 / OCM 3 / 743B) TaxID=573061 RepID=D9SUK3_CLOC7|nr:glycosyl hydrolase family 18 protein [Clostridium cellulovorans]ADL50908.1 glycoside hydrolase family 18 [Clostridium cellulovorans 743B]